MSEDQDSKFLGKCDICNQEKMVFNTVDPFEQEINLKEIPMTLCRNCYQNQCDDI